MREPNRLLLAGDVHGNVSHLEYIFKVAQKESCDAIVQLGDFGFWPHTESGQRFLRRTKMLILSTGIPLWWLDGNHSNHAILNEMPIDPETGLRPMVDATYWRDRSFSIEPFAHLPRGFRWEWNDVKFCAFGGASSIDKPWRVRAEQATNKPQTLWWPQETITEADLLRFGAGDLSPVDIMLTHDVPWGVDCPTLRDQVPNLYPDSDRNRKALAAAVDMVQPALIVHGHMHEYYTATYEGDGWEGQVVGLHCDGHGAASHLTIDLDDWKARPKR